jgi:2-phospho-L-lactate guanylyltransferase
LKQKVIAIIPIKGLANVKRRLASRLRRRERAALVLRLLDRELSVLVATAEVDSVIVVTADDRVAKLAEMRGALIALHPDNGVNSAIQAGIEQANRQDAELIVALHGDLPFVETEDIEALIDASEPGTLVLAPDRRQQGTNAIVLRRSRSSG